MKEIDSSLQKQRGQASVFVILFSAVLIVAAMSLFKAGKITTNKMQLQNAADAVAYSMSVVEARDLNFASYMNRAIVANEVGIAQFVGLASWAYHFQSFAQYIGFYNNCCLAPATLGASNAFIQPLVTSMASARANSRQIDVKAGQCGHDSCCIISIRSTASLNGYHYGQRPVLLSA